LTGALHVLQLQSSPPLPLSLALIKPDNPDSPGKMEREGEGEGEGEGEQWFQQGKAMPSDSNG